jgi:hypothetical protein
MPDGMVGERYQHQLQVTGQAGDYEWEKTDGDLPVGLTLGTLGTISGTPRHDGIARFKVQYTGGDGQPSSPYPVSLTVHRQLKITRDLSLRADLEAPGDEVLADLHAEGGTGPYRWSMAPGIAPPPWPRLTRSGRLYGAPPARRGRTAFTVQVMDSANHVATARFVAVVRGRWRRRTSVAAVSVAVRASLRERLFRTSNYLGFLAISTPLSGVAGILLYAFSTSGDHLVYLGTALLTSLTAFVVGCLAGFLFGIPRAVSSGQLRQQKQASAYAPSSNLAEVSDWLTKLLLGAGLVQLTHLGRPVGNLIDTVARGLHGTHSSGSATVMAAAILFGYTAIGLLDSYVVTTMWYQDHMNKRSLQ